MKPINELIIIVYSMNSCGLKKVVQSLENIGVKNTIVTNDNADFYNMIYKGDVEIFLHCNSNKIDSRFNKFVASERKSVMVINCEDEFISINNKYVSLLDHDFEKLKN